MCQVLISVPTRDQRYKILAVHTSSLPLGTDVELQTLADLTNSYVGADLASLCREAAYLAMTESTQSAATAQVK